MVIFEAFLMNASLQLVLTGIGRVMDRGGRRNCQLGKLIASAKREAKFLLINIY